MPEVTTAFLRQMTSVLRHVGQPLNLRLLTLLEGRALNQREILSVLRPKVPKTTVGTQLRRLTRAGLVAGSGGGAEARYSTTPKAREAMETAYALLCRGEHVPKNSD